MAHIRVESDERVARNAKVFFVPTEGEEVDISHCVSAVDLSLSVGDVSTATLRVFVGGARVTAEVEDIIVNRLVDGEVETEHIRRTSLTDHTRRYAGDAR